jgi:hypothetical protein
MGDGGFRAGRVHEFAARADARDVMLKAADGLMELQAAGQRLEEALSAAGLPQHARRTEQDSLRLLSTSLPDMSVDVLLARLEDFAVQQGPAWLHGKAQDLRAFREEADYLDRLMQGLREAVQRLQKPTLGNRADRPLQRAFSHPGVLPPISDIGAILGDLIELAPFMKPLAPQEWRDARGSRGASVEHWTPPDVSGNLAGTELGGNVAFAATQKLIDPQQSTGLGALGAALHRWTAALVGRGQARRRLPLAAGLCVLVVAVAGMALAHASGPSAAPPASTRAASGSARTVATPKILKTVTPSTNRSAVPSPQETVSPAPKLALTCVVHGMTATLTLRNTGISSLVWQAKSPPTLSVSPARGILEPGGSVTAQVTTTHKKTASGTVTVIASQGGASASSSVSCQ